MAPDLEPYMNLFNVPENEGCCLYLWLLNAVRRLPTVIWKSLTKIWPEKIKKPNMENDDDEMMMVFGWWNCYVAIYKTVATTKMLLQCLLQQRVM